jgi:uncharacterized membrane protein YphA (DoxX/SURF4 family)
LHHIVRANLCAPLLDGAGIPFPAFNTIFASTVEFVFGSLLILGVLPPLACAMLGCVMIVTNCVLKRHQVCARRNCAQWKRDDKLAFLPVPSKTYR